MKKSLLFVLALVTALVFVGCSKTPNVEKSDSSNSENSVITDSQGNIGNSDSSAGTSVSRPSVSRPSGDVINQGTVKVLSCYGDFENATVTVSLDSQAYSAYYKASGSGQYKKVDNQLIRRYNDCVRIDIPGLSAGKYEVKIVKCVNGADDENSASVVSVDTLAHRREGFAFSSSSPNKTGSGAYNDNGTLKDGAKVLYITKDNINTVTLDVIKDSKGKTETGVGLLEIMYLRGKGYDKTPLCVRFLGLIKDSDIVWQTANVKADANCYINVKGCYNVTFEGVGSDATCYGWSLKVRDANNVEIRNFAFMLFKDDGVTIDTDNYNVWVHNNDFFYGAKGSDNDQEKGDGSCDNKKSSYLTISYNHFWDSGKAILCGMGDTKEYFATFHHNWFDHSDSRHPRIRVGTIHVYNNFYDGVSKYGIGSTTGSSCFAENNYFLNTKKPILSSGQGTDAQGSGTFSGEDGGIVKAFGNIYDGSAKPIGYSSNPTSFDCFDAQSAEQIVPQTVKTKQGGTTYNNFDTSESMYDYTADAADSVPQSVRSLSGRIGGGDFVWNFTAADNSSYSVNSALQNAIINYKTSLVSVGNT